MKPTAQRLLLTAMLFVGWLAYLTYLTVCQPHTPSGPRGALQRWAVTLSRPQFLVSTLDVVAEVQDDKGETVIVKEVLFPKAGAAIKPGDTIRVDAIERCRPLPNPEAKDTQTPSDYIGPGLYLLPLQFHKDNEKPRFEVAFIPPSPGFPLAHGEDDGPTRRIYPATEAILAEYRTIAK
ncbi:MAG: hypothetical protein ACRELF_29065 [Gemmataceae bacterium]